MIKKLLITGAHGFIGNYFCANYSQTYDIQTFSFLRDDFDSLDIKSMDVVLHLSALVHHMGGASADEYERVNVANTLKLAQKAKEGGVRHFVFMSTIKVYGEETSETYNETSACLPKDEYGKSKLRAEQELLNLASDHFIVSIIRTPVVYGHGVKANIKNLVNLVSKVSVLPFAGIKNKRSFVYVGNLCAMLEKIITTTTSGVFLASEDIPLSTTRLIELIASEMNKKIYLVKLPFFAEFLKWMQPSLYQRLYESLEVDNTQTKKLLDFKNLYTIEEGVHIMIQGIGR